MQRVLAVLVACVLGLVVALIGGTLLVGFGDPLLWTVAVVVLLAAVTAWCWPKPYLGFARVVLGIIGVEV